MESPNFSSVRQSIVDLVSEGQLPSLVVAVAQHGKILWREAFGWANRENRTPARLDTIYPVASISKSMTATGLMILVERGLVDLDAPVTHYLPAGYFAHPRQALDEVTIRRLLNMTAAIPHLWKYAYDDEADARFSTMQLLQRHACISATPGKYHLYSNLSYGVIEQVIVQVTGGTFGNFLHNEVFQPLGMTHTALKTDLASKDALSTAYDADNQPVPWDFHLQPDGGAGFYSTGDDLLRYSLFHLAVLVEDQRPLLSHEMLNLLHYEPDPQAPNAHVNPTASYAMGWGIVNDGRYTSLWSNGAMLGSSAMVMLIPTQGISVVCLSNYTSPDAISDQKAIEIAGVLLPGFAENLQARISEVIEAEGQPDANLSGDWKGTIILPDRQIPILMKWDLLHETRLQVGTQPETAIKDLHFGPAYVEGRAECQLPLETTLHREHSLVFELRLENDHLSGVVRAESRGERPYFGLPFYLSLGKQI